KCLFASMSDHRIWIGWMNILKGSKVKIEKQTHEPHALLWTVDRGPWTAKLPSHCRAVQFRYPVEHIHCLLEHFVRFVEDGIKAIVAPDLASDLRLDVYGEELALLAQLRVVGLHAIPLAGLGEFPEHFIGHYKVCKK